MGPVPSLRVLQSKPEEGRFKVDEEDINGLNHVAKVSQWYTPPVPGRTRKNTRHTQCHLHEAPTISLLW